MDRPPIWLRPERAARGPRPAHSREEIAAAAVRVADAEGLAAVSMRRVATELGTGTTSLYRYVDGKDELFDLMVDRAMGDGEPPVPTGDWRVDLAAVAHAQRAMMLRHPWLVRLPATRPVLGPNTLAWLEATYAAVDVPGLDADEVLAQAATLLTFVRGGTSGGTIHLKKQAGNYLASSGFPLNNGNPYGTVKMNSNAIGNGTSNTFINYCSTIMAHEIGHCIGFRHTDYMNRAYSCGGSPVNEGASNVGAVHIPGTPTGPDSGSWMLACIGNNQNRPFNNNDGVALDYIY